MDGVDAAVGAPAQPPLVGVGVEQAMPCRSNAAWIAVMCGVPSARLPLSSSAASHWRYALVAPQPSEVEGQAQACQLPMLPLPW
jgi:hypothetical protein